MTHRTFDSHIGKRVNELRLWRKLSLRELAGMAGCSAGHLSKIERGLEPCDNRALINALAVALKVAPNELTPEPLAERDPVSREAHEGLERISMALAHNSLGNSFHKESSPWAEIEATLRLFTEELHPSASTSDRPSSSPD